MKDSNEIQLSEKQVAELFSKAIYLADLHPELYAHNYGMCTLLYAIRMDIENYRLLSDLSEEFVQELNNRTGEQAYLKSVLADKFQVDEYGSGAEFLRQVWREIYNNWESRHAIVQKYLEIVYDVNSRGVEI